MIEFDGLDKGAVAPATSRLFDWQRFIGSAAPARALEEVGQTCLTKPCLIF